jgi:hypothetical protein
LRVRRVNIEYYVNTWDNMYNTLINLLILMNIKTCDDEYWDIGDQIICYDECW